MKLRYKIGSGLLMVLAVGGGILAYQLSRNEACPQPPVPPAGGEVMQAVTARCYGSPQVLALESVARPVPANNEVLVKVRAAGVNPLDWHYMRGSPYVMRLESGLGLPADWRVGVDFAGTVEAVGSAVTRFKPGDAVFGGRSGAFAQYVLVPEDRAIVPIPDGVSLEQAASVGIAGVTALQALVEKGHIQPGNRVLINGASGGVGTFAVQIASHFGAEVTGVCSTRNLAMVRSLGADHVIDYTQQNFLDLGKRYDLVVDLVGNHPPESYRHVLESDGRFVLVGGAKGDWIGPLVNPLKVLVLDPFLDAQYMNLLAELRREDLAFLADLMATGKLSAEIDRRYPLAEVADAIAYSETGRARGKILLTMP